MALIHMKMYALHHNVIDFVQTVNEYDLLMLDGLSRYVRRFHLNDLQRS